MTRMERTAGAGPRPLCVKRPLHVKAAHPVRHPLHVEGPRPVRLPRPVGRPRPEKAPLPANWFAMSTPVGLGQDHRPSSVRDRREDRDMPGRNRPAGGLSPVAAGHAGC